jgi:acyl-CoA thioester hydrolase
MADPRKQATAGHWSATTASVSRSEFRLAHPLRVRWAEVDPQSIVFNAHYLMYFDVAATEYWREVGCEYPAFFLANGVDTFVVKTTLEFRAPARYDDQLEICMRAARLGRSSIRMLLEIHRSGMLLVSGELVYVIASANDRAPTPIPAPLRAAIVAYESIAPEQG